MSLRPRVLAAFRNLHKTRQKIFAGDKIALNAGREKINNEFKQNKDQTDISEIEKLVKLAEDSELILRTTVVQARKKEEGVFEVQVTPETYLGTNTVFDPDIEIPIPRRKAKKSSDASKDT